jgi:hypothetical protein
MIHLAKLTVGATSAGGSIRTIAGGGAEISDRFEPIGFLSRAVSAKNTDSTRAREAISILQPH